jgi:hypothetical protein
LRHQPRSPARRVRLLVVAPVLMSLPVVDEVPAVEVLSVAPVEAPPE